MPFSAAIFFAEGEAEDWAPAGEGVTAAAEAACLAAGAVSFGAAPVAAATSVSMIAITSPLVTDSPSFLMSLAITPSAGAGSSSTTLSVSMSIRFSSRFTASPAFLCQLTSVASATDSGSCGTLTSTLIAPPSGLSACDQHFAASQRRGECILDELLLLGRVLRGVANRRRRRDRAARVVQRLLVVDVGAQVVIQPVPGALVLRLLLAPD